MRRTEKLFALLERALSLIEATAGELIEAEEIRREAEEIRKEGEDT